MCKVGVVGSVCSRPMSDPTSAPPFRILPALVPQNEHFWTGGSEGELRFLRCRACGWWLHPAGPICPSCLSKDLAVAAVSGRGTVHAFTVNWQPWIPGFDPPYVIAIVELPEQDGLRVTTNIVGCEPDLVETGMPVAVEFEHNGDVWLPLFHPEVAP